MMIVWRAEMSVGHEAIDQDHQLLIAILNSLELASVTEQGDPVFRSLLDQLDAYTRTHFRREESLQAKFRFGHADAHAASHRRLERELADIQAKFSTMGLGDERKARTAELATLSRRWLIGHILHEDLLMRPMFDPPLDSLVVGD